MNQKYFIHFQNDSDKIYFCMNCKQVTNVELCSNCNTKITEGYFIMKKIDKIFKNLLKGLLYLIIL